MFASNSPEHIVGNHVLHRLCVPRYPPLALISLTKIQLLIIQTNTLSLVCDVIHFTMQFSRFYCWKFIQQSGNNMLSC
jgi:hypothetical protein